MQAYLEEIPCCSMPVWCNSLTFPAQKGGSDVLQVDLFSFGVVLWEIVSLAPCLGYHAVVTMHACVYCCFNHRTLCCWLGFLTPFACKMTAVLKQLLVLCCAGVTSLPVLHVISDMTSWPRLQCPSKAACTAAKCQTQLCSVQG